MALLLAHHHVEQTLDRSPEAGLAEKLGRGGRVLGPFHEAVQVVVHVVCHVDVGRRRRGRGVDLGGRGLAFDSRLFGRGLNLGVLGQILDHLVCLLLGQIGPGLVGVLRDLVILAHGLIRILLGPGEQKNPLLVVLVELQQELGGNGPSSIRPSHDVRGAHIGIEHLGHVLVVHACFFDVDEQLSDSLGNDQFSLGAHIRL